MRVAREICFAYSDDDGFTWQESPAVLQCPFETIDGYEEPGVHILPDGRLWCYIRTNMGYQFECFSADEGVTWTVPKPNLFFSSPCSPMHVKPFNDLTLAIFNPESEHVLRGWENTDLWGRTPYTLAVSTDNGKTFTQENLFYIDSSLLTSKIIFISYLINLILPLAVYLSPFLRVINTFSKIRNMCVYH